MTTAERMQEFFDGKSCDMYEYLGAHLSKNGVDFRTYAPSACGVNIFGDFNQWTEEPMERDEYGVYHFHSDKAKKGDLYKYVIYGQNGWRAEHTDPYAFEMELRPQSAARITDLEEYRFKDQEWMKKRDDHKTKPLSIYEMHIGSFRKAKDGLNGWHDYREMAPIVIGHMKKLGYTHVELMPVCEYPYDGSWGYQLTGYFAATSRYGMPAQINTQHYGTPGFLKYFIDQCHEAGIGVIMDFVPVHFAVDDYALKLYDTTPLYEYYPNGNVGSQWGSCMFNHARNEVVSFLLSSANFWLKEYHFDGLRVDAVSNLIYNNGDKTRGENHAGMNFARRFTTTIKELHPDIMLFAEDSSSWQGGVTAPVEKGGLGFDYKWNMGWMYDSLYFLSLTPRERVNEYHKMTFSMWYYYSEKFILSLSHDEVVSGAKTIIEKIPGTEEEKFAQARTYYAYMYAHPGKKLSFMGNELGERTEWNESREVEFELLEQPLNKGLFDLICDLQKLYMENDAYYAEEYEVENFKWLYCEQGEKLLYVMKRFGKKKSFVTVMNFGDNEIEEKIKIAPEEKEEEKAADEADKEEKEKKPVKKKVKEEAWKLILHSGWKKYGGAEEEKKQELHSKDAVMEIHIPAYSAMVYEIAENVAKK